MKLSFKINQPQYLLRMLLVIAIVIVLVRCTVVKTNSDIPSIYAKQNLVAWCIVPFDSKNRGPEERAEMLNDLGITKLAYDWRDHHIPTFDQELQTLKKNNIKLQGFWLASGPDPANDKNLDIICDALERNNVKTQLWSMFGGWKDFDNLTQQEKVETAAKTVAYVANKLDKIGCSLGLYNHGGWFGEPENQVAIIEHLKMPNIGIVYNFSHAETQANRFEKFYPAILPYLYAINITGLKGGHPAEVVPVGQGNLEEDMMRLILESSYMGPIGIINEDFADDAKDGLIINMIGIQEILKKIGDRKGLSTYK
jgi:sugar phosphate isomerase/epimerase